jgi:type II secretory pathway predicted ATPase ExeA
MMSAYATHHPALVILNVRDAQRNLNPRLVRIGSRRLTLRFNGRRCRVRFRDVNWGH